MSAPRSVPDITEGAWQANVIELAHVLGWRVAHFRPARTLHGWRTAVAADGCGFPDLVLTRERLVVAELKARRGRLTADQRAWLDALAAAGVEAYLWRPDDWPHVCDVLQGRGRPVGGRVS